MPEPTDQGPHTARDHQAKAPSGEAIPLLPRVTESPGSTDPAGAAAPRGVPGPPETTESVVRLPRRQRSGPPVPWSLRRDADDAPRTSWIPLGTVDSGVLAAVDPAGLVALPARSWSLDWWVRAEDRWHHPSMEPAFTQSAEGATPVVRTAVRVPGGEVVHRCCGAQVHAGAWSGPAAAVEVTNESAVPVALALVVRPYRLDGRGGIASVEMLGAGPPAAPAEGDGASTGTPAVPDGVVVRIDGTDSMLVDRRPARVAHGTPAEVATALAGGSDDKLEGAAEPLAARRWSGDADGELEVAFVFPLAHTATVSATLPSQPQPQPRPAGARPPGRRRGSTRARGAEPSLPVRTPEIASVLRGWDLHSTDDPALTWVVDAAEGFVTWSAGMLRVAGPDAVTRALDPSVTGGSRSAGAQLEIISRALATLSPGELHLAVAAALIRAQRFSGRVEPVRGQDATIALVWTAAALLRGPDGPRRAGELVGPVAKALRWLDRDVPDGATARVGEHLGGGDRALRQVAVGLSAVGQPELAARALGVAARIHGAVPGADPGSPADGSPGSPRDGTPGGAADGAELRSPFVDPDEDRAHRLLSEVPGAMPGARHLDRGRDRMGDGQVTGFDVVALADLRNRLLSSVAVDTPEGAALFALWTEDWNGRLVEVHRMPTAWGRVSAAVRWHGAKAALLWDVQPWSGDIAGPGAPVITAPGLSPGWSGSGWNGDALIEPLTHGHG